MLRGGDEESAYGFDVSEYIGAVGPRTAVASLPGAIRGELMKDDRVSDVDVEALLVESAPGLFEITLQIAVVLEDGEEEFSLSVLASETSVALIGGIS
jgi:hypothetical protein